MGVNVKLFLTSILSVFIVSCATQQYELPANYKGSTAVLKNGINRSAGKLHAELYSVVEINGVADNRSAIVTTGPYGTYTTTDREISRKIPTGRNLVKIRVSRLHAAPIIQIADSATGAKQSLSGDVYFKAIANRTYEVKGSLAKGQEAVWLQDNTTGRMVGRKIK